MRDLGAAETAIVPLGLKLRPLPPANCAAPQVRERKRARARERYSERGEGERERERGGGRARVNAAAMRDLGVAETAIVPLGFKPRPMPPANGAAPQVLETCSLLDLF